MKVRHTLLTAFGGLMLLGSLQAQAESTLRIGLGADPDMLDPHLARTYYGRFVFAAMCDRLVDVDENLKVVPGLATDWKWSEDGKTIHGTAVRTEKWRYAEYGKDGANGAMLFDPHTDPLEMKNLATDDQYKPVVAELSALTRKYASELG